MGLILFEDIPLYLNAIGVIQQILYGFLLKDFPVVRVTSVAFMTAVMNLILHHYLAIKYFGQVHYAFSEVSETLLFEFII